MKDDSILDFEQSRILDLVDTLKAEGKGWTKYNGDVVCTIIRDYLSQHLPSCLKIIGPNAYVTGHPAEFDLLVADAAAPPREHTNAYFLDQVCCIIEVKNKGIFKKKAELADKVHQLRELFLSVEEENPKIRCACICVEMSSPRLRSEYTLGSDDRFVERRTSAGFDRIDVFKNALSPFPLFVLRNRGNRQPYKGCWKACVNYLVGANMG